MLVKLATEFNRMLQEYGSTWGKGIDQVALAVVLSGPASEDSVVHDSYLCIYGYLKGALPLPFPTQRLSGENFTLPEPGVNFTNILQAAFSYKSCFVQLFFYFQFGKRIMAQKLLVKCC